jgi:pyruvate dehydrogenase E1 component
MRLCKDIAPWRDLKSPDSPEETVMTRTARVDQETPRPIEALTALESRLRWLSSWTIHNANHLRDSRDGLKVGGHQASCASMTAIMSALYFHALRPQDKVAVKPHASPVLHAIHYLLGNQSLDQLQRSPSTSPRARSVSASPSPPSPVWRRTT